MTVWAQPPILHVVPVWVMFSGIMCLTVFGGLGGLCTLLGCHPQLHSPILHVRVNLSGWAQLLCTGMHSHAGLQALGAAAAVSVLMLHSHTGRPFWAIARYAGWIQ
jgi:hypothetical protein